MSLEKTLKKVLSVTLVVAFMLQQTGFVFAATDESTWTSLKTDVEATAGEYNVTTALTADEEGGSGEGTISITADGNTITGASLTQNSTNDPLFNVGSAVTSFNLGNDVSGSIVNDGTMTYTGSSLADGAVTGSGKFVFGGTTTNANTINQTTVETNATANVTNNAAVTATTFTNKGTFDNNALLTATIVNEGTLSSTADNLAGTVENNNALTLEGGTVQAAITGTGDTDITADLTSDYAITQGNVTISGNSTFTNNALVTANISNTAGSTLLTDPANLGGAVANEGIVKLNADGNLTQNITGTAGKTEIRADVNNQATISQDTIKVGTGSALTSDADNLVATTEIFNDGTLNLTAGTNANAINGDGDVVFSNTVTNNGAIAQTSVANSGALTNNAAVTAQLTNTGTIDGSGSFKLTDVSSSTGDISQNGFDTNGFDFSNTAALTTNATFVNAATFSGVGGTLTLAAGTANNSGTITQDAVNNSVGFTNTGTINTDSLQNVGNFLGNGIINLTGDSVNSGTITQDVVTLDNNMTFANNGMLLAQVTNASGSTLNSDPDNLGKNVFNSGTVNLNGAGTLGVLIDGTGDTNINGDLTNNGQISQANINVASGYVVTSNASDMTATTAINNAGTINYTAGSTANTITGAGRVDITGYVTNTGNITQTTVGNSGVFTNNGTVTANLENTKTIEGTGDIVTGTGISSNTGTLAQANLTNNGTFDNTGHITLTGALTNADTFNTNADLLAAAGGVANAGNLNITGGTNANVITGAGVTNFTGDATNNAAITQTTVTNTAKLTNNALITADVTNSGTLTSDGANIAGDIANTGSYIITGGNNANDIIGAGGKTTILGNTTNTGTIMQESLAIANSGNLTTDSDLITASITNDGKLVWNAGTANQNVIDGTGELHINGADIVNSSAISQDSIKVLSGSLTSNADLLASAKGITNNDGLTFTGGTNANVISGTGDLTTTGDVTNNAAISQNTITVTSGKLTTAADTLTTVNGVVNNSEISFTGGDNNNDISGTGTTYIDGTVQNLASIDTVIQVNTGAHYGTATDILKKLDNRGTTDLIDADIASTGKISGTGVTNILGATVNNSSISQSAVNIAAGGSLTTDSQKVEAAITNDGDLIWNAGNSNANAVSGNGNLNITGGTTIANTASISQGNITITNGTLSTDADLVATTSGITNNDGLKLTGGTNANVISGTGDLEVAGNVTNNAAVNQNTITVSSGKLTTAADTLTTVNGIVNNSEISFTGGDNSNDITGTGLVYIDGNVQNDGDIYTDIQVNTGAHYGTATDVLADLENRGTTDLVDADIYGNIDGTGTLNILGATVNNGTIDQTALTIAAAGSLTTDSDQVAAAITNDGDLVWNAGTGNGNTISGNGNLNITGGTTIANTASISQGNITITNGTLSTDASLLASTSGITNNDGLTFTGGTNTNTISGTGALTTTGDVVNQAGISQDSLTVSGGQFTSDAGLLAFANGVTNNAALSLTGGTNSNVITGTGTTFIDGTVENTGTIDTNIGVGVSGHYATSTDITKALANNGITDITNADVNAAITGTGTTNILGTTTNNSTITQSALNIASSGAFDTNIDNVTAAISNEGAFTITNGTANANVISGNGSLEITGGNIANTASISQGNITITGGALSTDAGLLASASGITNNADLTFTGGTNANAITGTGDLITTGDVTNNAAISQNSITVSGGKLTTAADALTTVAGITNNSEISLTGGDNLNDISGTGLTYIDGTVTNAADITTDIQINAGANLGTLNDIVSTVENRGLLQIVDADITSTGKVKGTGDVNILGDTTNSGKINATTVNVVVGSHLTTDSDKVEASIVNDGDLTWNAGTANANVISGTGALEITGGTTIANTATISQADITITNGALSTDAGLLATVNGITNNDGLTFTGGTNTNAITGTGDLTTTGDVTNQAAIAQATVTNSGTLANEGTITADVTNTGVLASDGDDITGDIANSGTYVITDGDNANDITGTGDVQIEGTTINTGTIAQDNIFVAAGASLVASDISDITTTTGIDNAGVLELQSGANANVIGGNTGTLKITGVVTNNAGVNINQDTIDIATLGDFTANAGNLKTVNGITNSGALTLGDGATANNISGTGTLAVTGTVTNTGNMDQKSLNITGALQSNADLLAFADGITNTGTLDLTGGTNANTISGTGTTNFTNDVINNGEITQATVTNAAGTLTNNAAITATFVNNTGTVNNEAAITGAITNTSGTINSTADNLVGVVTNNGTLNVAGGTVQNTISGAGDMNITADLVNAQNINQATVVNDANMTNSGAITVSTSFTNNGVVDNTAAITGAIVNTGTINSTATNLVGTVNNTGTLNLDGGTTQGAISGAGDTNITADLTNNFAINQTNVTNTAALTNNATITATDITNSGTITGAAANLVASNEIANSGSLIFNAASTGASNITGAGDVQVTANTTLTGANTYTGGTLIDAATLTVAGASNIGTGDVTFANNGILDVTAAGSLDNNLVGQTPATDDVTVQNAAALTLNGNIGAAKDFHKAGAGDMTFAMASNSYTGDTYVDGGKLIGNTGNINNTVNGAAGTTVEFTDTTDAELNAINTLGTFVQSGSAKLNVQTNAFSANQADINAGIFAANRALTANTLNVNGAKLQGNGNITGTVNVNAGATLAPGNSIDTLTITGNLNLASGSTTAIEITDTPASDKVVVTGNANIAGGANLTVSNVSGRYFEWESFDIMEAANVAGTFTYDGSVSDYDTSRINVDVDYSNPTKVTLTAKRKATTYGASPAGALSRNEREVAQAVDAVSTGFGGDITNALLQLEQLGGLNPTGVVLIDPSATFQSALNNLAGSLYANSALLPLFNAKTAHVYDRIAKRNPSTGACPTCHDNVWVEYYNQYDKVYANQNSSRFTNNMTGVMAGYDRSSDELLLGIYGGYGESDLRQLNDKMDIEDGTLGIYSGYMNGNWLVKGSLFTGRQNYYGKRHITFMGRTATARYEGWNAGLDVEGSYNLAVFDWMNVKPFVGVFGNYAHQQAFTEKDAGALSLHVESHDQVTVQGRLGFQLDGKVFKNRLSWYGSVAVKQIFGNDYAKLHMSFDLPGTRMDILGAELGRTYLSGQVGLNYAITDSLSLYGNLDTGVNDKSANCYGNIGVAYTW